MKKAYMKPGMYVENFSLSQSIAAGCGHFDEHNLGDPNFETRDTCGWEIGGKAFWLASTTSCTTKLDENTPMFGVCYNNPNEIGRAHV